MAAAIPAYLQRRAGIGQRFVTGVLASAEVELPVWLFDYSQGDHNATPCSESAADQAGIGNAYAMTLRGCEKLALAWILRMA